MLTRDEAERRVIERAPPDAPDLFQRYVPGGSFADLGYVWNVHGAHAFCAELVTAACSEKMLRCFGFVVEEKSRYVLALTPGSSSNPTFSTFVARRQEER